MIQWPDMIPVKSCIAICKMCHNYDYRVIFDNNIEGAGTEAYHCMLIAYSQRYEGQNIDGYIRYRAIPETCPYAVEHLLGRGDFNE